MAAPSLETPCRCLFGAGFLYRSAAAAVGAGVAPWSMGWLMGPTPFSVIRAKKKNELTPFNATRLDNFLGTYIVNEIG